MGTTVINSTSADLQKLILLLRSAYAEAPDFGSITISAQFVDGQMVLGKKICEETIKPGMGDGK
jgi:hypothetical protein